LQEFDPALPARTCVGCRSRAEKSQLLRVVVVGDACIPDDRARLPGRGAYLHRTARCLELADKRRAFPRAFRVPGPLDVTALAHHLHETHDTHDTHDPGATAAGHDTRAGR
jgi:predicted RNA-binding protein YlxR (DUF448 family)